jgi:hypothetical protein
MKVTNRYNIPDTFLNFEKANSYSSGDADMGVTTLIGSARIRKLRQAHHEELTEDISERIMSILGTAVHNILETGADEEDVVEERLYQSFGDTVISGQVDLRSPVEGGWVLSDYKTCSAFAIKKSPGGKIDWEEQLNVYRLLAEVNDHTIKGLEVVAVVRDWTRAAAERDKDYPQSAVIRIPIRMWDIGDTWKFVEDRVKAHKEEGLPDCSEEEMWSSPPVYAVFGINKDGSKKKRATRLFDHHHSAEMFRSELGVGATTEVRPGRRARCEGNYCGVASVCTQFKQYKDKQELDKL